MKEIVVVIFWQRVAACYAVGLVAAAIAGFALGGRFVPGLVAAVSCLAAVAILEPIQRIERD